jgi:hypothetical protein
MAVLLYCLSHKQGERRLASTGLECEVMRASELAVVLSAPRTPFYRQPTQAARVPGTRQ